MKVITVASDGELNRAASETITSTVQRRPNLSIVLPTGRTPVGLYKILRTEYAAGRFSLNDAHVFMLDEYVDLPSYPEGSFRSFLRGHLGDLLFNEHTVFHPIPFEGDLESCEKYDTEIDMAGGIDLAVVGVGRNGHVGFNEPGAQRHERTHVVKLATGTLAANFPTLAKSQRPTRAVTMGMCDLLSARSVLMLVSGSAKSKVLKKMSGGVVDPRIPATYLVDHPDFTIVADAAAWRGVSSTICD